MVRRSAGPAMGMAFDFAQAERSMTTSHAKTAVQSERSRRPREALTPAPLHPAQQRLHRRDPDDPRDDIEGQLQHPMPLAHHARQAGDERRPGDDDPDDQQHAGRFAPTGGHGMIHSDSVAMAWSGMSQLSGTSASISCTLQAIPTRQASGWAANARS